MRHEFTDLAELLQSLTQPVYTDGFCVIAEVPPALAKEISRVAGLEATGFNIVLDRSGIQHTLKQHGQAKAAAEFARGQVPIENADFETLPHWLAAPHRIDVGQPRPAKLALPCVECRFSHPSGQYCGVLEFRSGRKELALVTMYKKRPANER